MCLALRQQRAAASARLEPQRLSAEFIRSPAGTLPGHQTDTQGSSPSRKARTEGHSRREKWWFCEAVYSLFLHTDQFKVKVIAWALIIVWSFVMVAMTINNRLARKQGTL